MFWVIYISRHVDKHIRDRMVFGFITIPMQSVLITTDVVSSNLDQGEAYNIMRSSLSVTCDRSVVFSGYFGFLHQ